MVNRSILADDLLQTLSPLPLLDRSSCMAYTSSVVLTMQKVIWAKLTGIFDAYMQAINSQHRCTQLFTPLSEIFLFTYFVQIKDDLIKEMLTRMPQLTAINFYHEDFRTETMVNYWFIPSAAHMTMESITLDMTD